jgi:hypothetical protein
LRLSGVQTNKVFNSLVMNPSDLVELAIVYLRVFLGKLVLVLRLVIKLAVMLLGVAMLAAENEVTLAGEA